MHITLMSRIVHRFRKGGAGIRNFIDNYIYYRKRFHSHNAAWNMAKNTINYI